MQKLILKSLDEMKAVDIKVCDIAKIASFADLLIIASGNSSRHVAAIATKLSSELKQSDKNIYLKISGLGKSEWVLIDTGSIVINIMTPKTREFYALEKLWDSNATTDLTS